MSRYLADSVGVDEFGGTKPIRLCGCRRRYEELLDALAEGRLQELESASASSVQR